MKTEYGQPRGRVGIEERRKWRRSQISFVCLWKEMGIALYYNTKDCPYIDSRMWIYLSNKSPEFWASLVSVY